MNKKKTEVTQYRRAVGDRLEGRGFRKGTKVVSPRPAYNTWSVRAGASRQWGMGAA